LTVASAASSITLSPTFNYPSQTANWDFHTSGTLTPILSGASTSALTILIGNNSFIFNVYAEDLSYLQYTINIKRISNNAYLNSWVSSPIASGFVPPFVFGTYFYTVTFAYGVSSCTLTPTLQYALASQYWTINSATFSPSLPSGNGFPVALSVGDTFAQVLVIAEDLVTTNTYQVKLHRQSNDHVLSSLSGSVTLQPTFTPLGLSYTMVTPYLTSSISITPVANYPLSKMEYQCPLGVYTLVPVVPGSFSCPLVYGANLINVRVTSEDASVWSVYAVNVYRQSHDSSLVSLLTVPAASGFVPAFGAGIFSYDLSMPFSATQLSVTATCTYSQATQSYAVDGGAYTSFASGTSTPTIPLPVGDRTIIVRVLAEDGVAQSSYVIHVHRLSTDGTLSSLVAMVTFVPPFNATTLTYTSYLPASISVFRVHATLAYGLAGLSVDNNGGGYTALTSNVDSALMPVSAGNSAIHVKVISEDGVNTNIYTINLYRVSGDATLLSLSLSPVGTGLSPLFNSTYLMYSVNYVNTVTTFTFTPMVIYPLSQISYSVNGATFSAPIPSATPTVPIPIAVGDTLVVIRVIAEDGLSSYLYSLTVHRYSLDCTLQTVTSTVTILPTFNPAVLSYSMLVGSAVTDAIYTVYPTSSRAWLSYTYNGGSIQSLSPTVSSPLLPLIVGTNTFVLTVQAEDLSCFQLYTFVMQRLSFDADILSLTPTPLGSALSPPFGSTTLNYYLIVPNSVSSVTFTAAMNYYLAKLRWSLNHGPNNNMTHLVPSSPVPLAVGENLVQFITLAEDTISTRTYSVTVRRLSIYAAMSSFSCSLAFTPTFTPGTLLYTQTVGPNVRSFTVTGVLQSALSTPLVSYDGGPFVSTFVSGVASQPYAMDTFGIHTLLIQITPEDQSSSTTYTLQINRGTYAASQSYRLSFGNVSSHCLPFCLSVSFQYPTM
jgi:hypothetical protein